ncbi:LacI family DNA-binding transcriptional regulator [Bacillus sp. DJP31]|uniref:LacI family DNA-binding transcriptional regulator n=1 Tax=Bacillus sp. DJP31 TaxID=3409789 RepID=UPI003BB5082D
MSTIKDVANEAEVSVATVSRVINNNGYVNEDTKKKVQLAIDKLNYKPNAVARSLFKKKSMTIGLILPDIKNPFFPEVARAIEDVTNSNGFTLILCNSDEDENKEQQYLDVLKQKYVDGVIMVTSTLTPKNIEKMGIPIVALDRTIGHSIPSVSVNNYQGARDAVQYLKSLGCHKIAHIRGPENVINADERCNGYLDEVKNNEWFHPELIVNGYYDIKRTIAVTRELLLQYPDIEAIFAGNDYMAAGVLKAALSIGRKVPDDLVIIGFDGIDLCTLTTPELSTMSQPIYEIGKVAATMLLDIIGGKPIEEMHHQYSVQLIERLSTKKSR